MTRGGYLDSGYQYGVDAEAPTTAIDMRGARARAGLRWNTGADLGLLVLRLVLGVIFMAHGAQKMFGSFGGPGIAGFTRSLEEAGFREAGRLAWLTAATELGGGALLVVGLFTPLAAAGLLGIMINVIWMKWSGGFFLAEGKGYEFELALAGMSAALVFAGAGRTALDRAIPGIRRPFPAGLVCLVIGVAAAVAVHILLRTPR